MTSSTKPELGSLEHYGVKGMKWGVHNGEVSAGASRGERKAAKQQSKLAYKAWKKEVGGEKMANEIFQASVKSFNKDVKIINNDPAFKGKDLTTNPRLRRQYDNAIGQTFNTHMANHSIARTVTNTGRAMIYQFDSTVGMMRATESQLVIHADDDDSPWPDFVAEMDELGHVTSLRPVKGDDAMAQAEDVAEYFLEHYGLELTDEQLAHYGVKGMKWGVRGSKGTTGVSRARGARIDRNERHLALFRDVKAGLNGQKGSGKVTGRVQKNTINALNRMTMGKKMTEKYYDMHIDRMMSHNDRLRSGKLLVRDRIGLAMTTTPASLVVSYRPKD